MSEAPNILSPVTAIYNDFFGDKPATEHDVFVQFETNDTIEQKLEKVWREMNVVDGEETPCRIRD